MSDKKLNSNRNMYTGERCSLRPFLKDKAEQIMSNYYYWFNNKDVTKYNSHGKLPFSKKDFDDFFNTINDNKIVLAIIDNETHAHIGNVSLQEIDWINRKAELAIVIGEPNFWGCGYAEEACNFMISHGFKKLNLHRIYLGTAESNFGMIRVAEKIGMTNEGIEKEAIYLEGEYTNVIKFGVLSEWIQ